MNLSLCLGLAAEEPVTLCLRSFAELDFEPVTQFGGRNDEPVTLFGCIDSRWVGWTDEGMEREEPVGVEGWTWAMKSHGPRPPRERPS
jgi:hypothetical protein